MVVTEAKRINDVKAYSHHWKQGKAIDFIKRNDVLDDLDDTIQMG